jgi:hypothetical protein
MINLIFFSRLLWNGYRRDLRKSDLNLSNIKLDSIIDEELEKSLIKSKNVTIAF